MQIHVVKASIRIVLVAEFKLPRKQRAAHGLEHPAGSTRKKKIAPKVVDVEKEQAPRLKDSPYVSQSFLTACLSFNHAEGTEKTEGVIDATVAESIKLNKIGT